ncbi:ImmA/IrrE family metallo-endopeptidase [Chryseobacterium flavum]|uniref:ImmA/IrrE family metallo-endopeptidase n=1 Tax=Chryseobacterium flavum TaxID=415851 RepID=UPI0028AC3FB8|nr:ImmA/IrrE family metallo-endopeptidase [Chryseobacterium flavum]
MIANSSFSKIKKIAEQISSEYNEKIIPLHEIAASEYLEIIYDHYEKGTFDGMTVYDNDEFYIHINIDNGNKIDSPRSRFTLAHEFGHYFIDTHRIGLKSGILEPHPSKIDRVQFRKIEQEADFFASCLLMPEEIFLKDISRFKNFSFEVIDFLSKEYNVSKTACSIRFADIGNHPIKIVYAENGLIKWSKNSVDFPYYKLSDEIYVPAGLLMGDYFKDVKTEIFKTEQIFARDCFLDERRAISPTRMFYEHCITHKNCALSIIWED